MKKVIIIMFLFLVFAGCIRKPQVLYPLDGRNRLRLPEDITCRYPGAIAHFNKENYEKAAELLKKHLRSDPEDIDAMLFLAECETRLNNNEESLEFFEDVLKVRARDRYALWGTYLVAIKLRRYEKAQALAGRLVKLDPHDIQARIALGNAFYRGYRFRRCIWEMRKALRFPDPPEMVYNLLGENYYEIGMAEKSEKAYEEALKKNPYSVMTREGLAYLKIRMGKPEESLENYRYVSSHAPRAIHALNVAGLCLTLLR
ncbi:MAG: tetratricopeptide repeat protein, partial [Candidatus Eremiobacteraeota bacterium]|nr:tetratricopeptide repeat protein [Candidatus Eremiobacteraeota bacterium]